jgi:hypothetical protein
MLFELSLKGKIEGLFDSLYLAEKALPLRHLIRTKTVEVKGKWNKTTFNYTKKDELFASISEVKD